MLEALRDAVHAEATERTWSQGVALARDGRVAGRRARPADPGGEIELEVRVPGRPTPFEVTLYPAHGDWECSCDGGNRVCSHVVAGVLSAVTAAKTGAEVPDEAARGLAAIRYLLTPAPGGVVVDRVLVRNERTEPLAGSLLSLVGTGKASAIATLEADLTADQLITARVGPLNGERLDRLLEVLADARDVRWKGEPVTTSREPVLPRAVVIDTPGGVQVRIEPDPAVREVVAVGVVRTRDGVLRPIGAVDLSGPRLDKLPQVFDVPRAAFPELIGQTLPGLAQRIAIEVRATGLPRVGQREPPRMAFDVEQDGDRLRVMPTLVYGDPPSARVDGNSLTHLSGTLPIRDLDAERQLIHRLRDELNLVPGRRVELTGKEAFAMQQRPRELAAHRRALRQRRQGGRARRPDLDRRRADRRRAVGRRPHGVGRRRAARLAGRHRSRPADRRRLGPDPDGVVRSARRAGRRPARDARRRPPRADLRPARSRQAVRRSRRAAAARARPPAAAARRVQRHPGRATAEGGFVGELRPYQQRGLDWLVFCRDAGLGCVLADDMGLGKTIQALAAIRGRTLVVSPTSVLFNWLAEITRFRPDLRIATYRGARRTLEPGADVVLTSYPILRNDTDVLAGVTWDTVILDESQTIKNPDSQVARAAYRLKARWRLTLSGTPVENRLDELWSQLHFTNPGLLGGRADFQERWAEPISVGDAAAAARLRERIRPFVLRRMKREVARELPPRTDAIMYVELDEAERVTYDAIRAATQSEVVALLQAGGGVMAALEALLRLRQAACHPALLPTAIRGGAAPAQSSKLERLLEALEDAVADGHSALVFSQWTSLLDLIEPHLDAAGIAFTRLDGTTRDRAGVVGDVPGRRRPAGHAALAQGRRHRPQPDRRRPRVPDRPVVEPRRRGPGRRPRPPHRPGQAGDGLPHGRARHRRGAHPRAAGRASAPSPTRRSSEAGGAAAITRDDLLALLA